MLEIICYHHLNEMTMSNSDEVFGIDIEKLKARNNPGAGNLPIPSAWDEMLSEVVMKFIEAQPVERSRIASLFTDQHSFTFIAFAERMASYAVRIGSKKKLFEGLAALVLDGGKFDSRENITVMAPLYGAALKIGVDPETLFTQAAALAPNEVSDVLRTFPNRPAESKILICMQFLESEDEDGFMYERVC